MTTHYIQIKSRWQGDRWRTALKVEDDKALADFVALGLAISEHEYGTNNPGLPGIREARCISKTKLQRESGLPALARAQKDIDEGWTEKVGTTKVARPQFDWSSIQGEVSTLIEAYHEEQKELEQQGTGDFLIYNMPLPLRDRLNLTAREQGKKATELAIELIAQGLDES